MTNAQIIYAAMLEMNMDPEKEALHTYAHWKTLGYQVKRGEKAAAKIQIYKYSNRIVTDEETGEEVDKSRMFMKVSAFFTDKQVEPIKEKKTKKTA